MRWCMRITATETNAELGSSTQLCISKKEKKPDSILWNRGSARNFLLTCETTY